MDNDVPGGGQTLVYIELPSLEVRREMR